MGAGIGPIGEKRHIAFSLRLSPKKGESPLLQSEGCKVANSVNCASGAQHWQPTPSKPETLDPKTLSLV